MDKRKNVICLMVLVALFTCFSIDSHAQHDSISPAKTLKVNSVSSGKLTQHDTLKGFWGIPFGCSKTTLIQKLKEKGIATKDAKGGNLSVSEFEFAGRTYFFALFRIINNKFYQADLFFKTGTPHIADDFQSIKRGIDAKYFEGESYSNFKYPYEKGDEHEETALALGYG